jgi:glyoxylase-like metal-dependent hydrolase (beta-lactamase superfamily II)
VNYQPAHFKRLPDPATLRGIGESLHFAADFKPVEVAPGVHWMAAGSNSAWIDTPEGVVMVDAGFNRPDVVAAMRSTTNKPVRYVVYTHGHEDHVFNEARFAEISTAETQVVAHALVPERLSKYEILQPHIRRTNRVQFHLPPQAEVRDVKYRYPDVTYWDAMALTPGRRIELFHGRGETDDATVVWVPDARVVFAGDFLISSLPNLGNPYKVPRYCRGWYETLERIRDLQPEAVAPGHGMGLVRGADARQCLDDTIRALRYLHDEVVRRLNEGETAAQMINEIHLPPELEDSPYLRQVYSRVEFAVMEIQRGYTGWYDGDPADLFPHRRDIVATELRRLVGDDAAILKRADALWQQGMRAEGLELLQVVLRADSENAAARRQRLAWMETLLTEDRCLMSRGVWFAFADEDRAALEAGANR